MGLCQCPKHQRSLGSNTYKGHKSFQQQQRTSNHRTNTVQQGNELFFFLPYLVFRRSSIFLQPLERVNNQEHAAGGAGKGPGNMGVRQGNGQMLAGFPTCRGGRWGRLTPHRDSELLQWFGLTGGWGDLQGPARMGEPPRPL